MRTTVADSVRVLLAALALILVGGCGARRPTSEPTIVRAPRGAYANVNGLSMYYEVHGSGAPLVMLHGGVSTIDNSFGRVIPILAQTRTVIAIEQQGHGHTADIDRPLSYEQMAEDTNALLASLNVDRADFFGWSDGGVVALRIAIRHPDRVLRLVLLSSAYDNEGEDGAAGAMESLTPEMIPAAYHDAYAKVAPDPRRWPLLVEKIKGLAIHFKGWTKDEVRGIQGPVLVMLGDHDIIRTEYAVQMAHLLPHAQLAILPGCDHFAIQTHPDWVVALSKPFLDAT